MSPEVEGWIQRLSRALIHDIQNDPALTLAHRALDIPHDEPLCIQEFDANLCDLQHPAVAVILLHSRGLLTHICPNLPAYASASCPAPQ